MPISRFLLPVWVVLLLASSGCWPVAKVYNLTVPEQRHLDVRQPEQFAPVIGPVFPAPATVSNLPPAAADTALTLDEAIRIALANAKVIRVLAGTTVTASAQTIYEPAISNTNIDSARAVFDPTLTVNNVFNSTKPPIPSLDPTAPFGANIFGTTTDSYDLRVRLAKQNAFGGTLSTDFDNTLDRFRPGTFALNPRDLWKIKLAYTQPLLKGGGLNANLAPVVIAGLNTEISYFQFKDTVQEMVRGVIEAYWAVVAARTDVWAKRQQVEQGDFAYQRAEARKKQGLGTSGEVAQTKVALYNFKASLIGAEGALLQREAALLNIIGIPGTDTRRPVPVTPALTARVDPIWEQLVTLADERRPDLIELRLIIEADQQSLLLARNQAQPQLDATAFYQWDGMQGRTPSGREISSSSGEFAEWSTGVNFSVPLGLRQGRAALRKAELILAKDRANLDQGVHAAIYQLTATYRNVAQDYEQYVAFKETRTAARLNLDQQLAEFTANRVIYLNVLQAITDWGNAVTAEAQALSQYNTNLATLERQTGTILETHGVWFFEERYRSLGLFGRLGNKQFYPAASLPGPNRDIYPPGTEPADKALELDRPAVPKASVPAPKADPLPPPRAIMQAPRPLEEQLPPGKK